MKLNRDFLERVTAWPVARWGGRVKFVVGAVVGALVAAGVVTLSGCGVSLSVEPGRLLFEQSAPVLPPSVVVPGK